MDEESQEMDEATQDTDETTPAEKEEYVDFEMLREKVGKFVRERDWEKYHNPKDIAVAISVEAGELLELFQWMNESEGKKIRENDKLMEQIKSELADVINHCVSMANALDIDLGKTILWKIRENEKKYPKERYRGVWKKGTE